MDRTELLESALDALPDGIALFGPEGEVMFWNHAAEAITGYAGSELLGRSVPETLKLMEPEGVRRSDLMRDAEPPAGHATMVRARHKLGHEVQTITRILALLDGVGERIGTAAVFHPAESLDALPRGEAGQDREVAASQAELEDRLQMEYEDFVRGELPLGVLWASVDQAIEMPRSHGLGACEAMFEKVEKALARGLRPGEELGRWGEGAFLIISHERTAEMLIAHGQALAGLARTADFRWWGDRIQVTVSIGAAQALHGQEEGLAALLERAQKAMESSVRAGGNRVTAAPERPACLQL